MNSIEVPYLTELITKNSHPLLGVIAWKLEEDLKNFWKDTGQSLLPISPDTAKPIWTEYDKTFGHRPDYQLWRIKIKPNFSRGRGQKFRPVDTEISLTWPDWYTHANMALTSSDPVIVWGSLSILPAIIHHEIHVDRASWHLSLWEPVELAEKRIKDLDILAVCPAYCGATAINLLYKIEHLRFEMQHEVLPVEQTTQYILDIERYIKCVDPSWVSGERIRFEFLENEDQCMARLRPYHPLHTQQLMTTAIQKIWYIITRSVKDINPITEVLLEKAKLFAKTAWLQAHWQRFQELDYQRKRGYVGTYKSINKLGSLYRTEANLLQIAALAALNAGDYLLKVSPVPYVSN
jgi:hypothetical protein